MNIGISACRNVCLKSKMEANRLRLLQKGWFILEKKTERNYGIDSLRLVSMYLVVILHVLGRGGVLGASHGVQYLISYLLESIAFCSVNCFALISGFVGFRENETKYSYAKYLSFWFPVFFYNFGLTLCAFLLKLGSVSVSGLLSSALPVSASEYWYVSAYTGLFFIIPWLNKLIRICSAHELNRMALILFAVFSVYACAANLFNDVFKLDGGYSFVWLIFLYIIGAWMKRSRIVTLLKRKAWLALAAANILVTWAWRVFVPSGFGKYLWFSYVSPTIVTAAVSLVAVFSTLRLQKPLLDLVKIFSPAAFGVYILHLHWTTVPYLTGTFAWIAGTAAWKIPFEVLLSAFLIFAVCLLIERIRISVFDFLKINQMIHFVERKLDGMLEWFFAKL